MEEKIAALAALGVTITATAIANNSTWPFVTIDQFQQRSASSLSLSGCLHLDLAPIVSDENRLAWEEYSVANKEWLTEGRAYQAEKGLGIENGLGSTGGDPSDFSPHILSIDESGAGKLDQGVSIMAEPNDEDDENIFFSSKLTLFFFTLCST